mgnify:CR=1 FL=1
MKKELKLISVVIASLLITIFILRLTTPKEIDDIHPNWPCEKEYIEKSEILWIMPMFNNSPISENKTWCEKMRNTNKSFGLHGIQSWYREFNEEINETHLIKAIEEYKQCLGEKPTMFKAPALKITKENKKLIKKYNMTLRTPYHQTIHKVYHCQNTGVFPNWFHDVF